MYKLYREVNQTHGTLTDFELGPPFGAPLSFENDAIFLLLWSLIVVLCWEDWGQRSRVNETNNSTPFGFKVDM